MLKQASGKLMLIVIALLLCSAPEAFSQSGDKSPMPTPTPKETRKTFTLQIEVWAGDSPEKVDRAPVYVESKEEGERFKKKTNTDRQGMASFYQVPQGRLLIQVVVPEYDTFGEVYDLQDNQTLKITLKKHPPL